MTPTARRIVIPIVVASACLGIAALSIFKPFEPASNSNPPETPTTENASDDTVDPAADSQATENDQSSSDPQDASADNSPETAGQPENDGSNETVDIIDFANVTAAQPANLITDATDFQPLGSRDWREALFYIEFSSFGAGIERVTLSDIYNTVEAKRSAERTKTKIANDEATVDDLPLDEQYVIQSMRQYGNRNSPLELPAFVARSIQINGAWVGLFDSVWAQVPQEPGHFVTELHADTGEVVATIHRIFSIQPDDFSITVTQQIENLTSQELTVQWLQYGPADLEEDRARYMDRRRYRIGHLLDQTRTQNREQVVSEKDFFYERSSVAKIGQSNFRLPANAYAETLWPNEDTHTDDNIQRYELSWFAAENRYFAMAVYPLVDQPGKDASLENVIHKITAYYDGEGGDQPGFDNVAIEMSSPLRTVPPNQTLELNYGIYAGPLDRHRLNNQEPYASLNMGQLILYQMSSFCAICTFQWLAKLLLMFLSFGHSIFADWGFAIILLVIVVRLLLHPITKRSQMSIQRFGKVMQKLKPEMDKLQKKYKGDPKRLQQEQMLLWREYGVSPFAMLGCLPMFLQMPIWVALYAMLYFAFDLRHEPAFWGVFQMIGDWPFLGDLSDGDHFFGSFDEPKQFLFWNITGINILPFLMGAIFFFQQKYMSPPPSATMSEQQVQTQKMMKIMMVVGFPLMLYSAPSGLTLYIMTSSLWGIIESRRIRQHVDSLDIDAEITERKKAKATRAKNKKSRDPQARAYQNALERARQKRKPKPKNYKKRDK